MKQVHCLELGDIKTCVIGNNIWIDVSPEMSVSFTREAVAEFIRDYKAILEKESLEKRGQNE